MHHCFIIKHNDSLGIVIASTYKELPMDQAPMQMFHSHGGISSVQRELFLLLTVQSLSRVQVFVTLWTAAHQAFLSITNSWSLLKLMAVQLIIPSNNLILCRPLLLLPSIFSSIRVFSNESVLCIR